MKLFLFDGKSFTPEELPGQDDEPDYVKWLDGLGFESFGKALGGEFDVAQMQIYKGPEKYPWLVDLMVGDVGMIAAICPNEPAMIVFIRDYCLPFVALNPHESVTQFYQRADEILFDERLGLSCAQRIGDRERRLRAYYKAERENRQQREKEQREKEKEKEQREKVAGK